MSSDFEPPKLPEIITLNVGGQLFTTTLTTLCQIPETMFSSMFSGRFPLKVCQDGSYFVDRDGTHFRWILNYLRDATSITPLHDKNVLSEILVEAKYYCIAPLVTAIEQKLHDNTKYITRVFYICAESAQDQNIATAIESPTIQVDILNKQLLWPYTKLECDAILITGNDIKDHASCLAEFIHAGGTVVVCGGTDVRADINKPSKFLSPFASPGVNDRRRSVNPETQKTLGRIHAPNHPILAGVEPFTFNANAAVLQFIGNNARRIADWNLKDEPAVAILGNALGGLTIGINFSIDELNLEELNMVRLLQNSLSLRKNQIWCRK